jgi:hypothetical protein
MFEMLGENGGEPKGIPAWADATLLPDLADFVKYAAGNHQPEHWLESLLLLRFPALFGLYESPRSQVVVGDVGKRGWKFIDMLALDRSRREIVVFELKLPKADGSAVTQVANYAQWVADNKMRLLDSAYGYFPDVEQPSEFRVAVALVAPAFTTNLADYVGVDLSRFRTRLFVANGEWRKNATVEEMRLREFKHTQGLPMSHVASSYDDSVNGVPLGHGRDDLRKRLAYCLIRISLRKWQIASRPDADLPLEVLMGLHDLDGTRITVAGRPKRLLSIEVMAPATVPPDAHERIITFVQRLL